MYYKPAAMRPYGNQNQQHAVRRDGSEASKAKSNKTVDVQHVYCNRFDNVNKISALFCQNKVLPPLESSDRQLTRPCEVLAKYVNRRKCEVKNREHNKQFADLQFCRYNPDGRFLFVGTGHGSVYLYNTYDFSFHYQYYVCNNDSFKQVHGLTDMQFFPDNSNLTFISTTKGSIVTIPNLLHFDSQDRQINNLKVFEEQKITRLAISSSGDEMAACGENGKLMLLNIKQRYGPQLDRMVQNSQNGNVLFQKGVNCACYCPYNQQLLACCGDRIGLVDTREALLAQEFQYQSHGEDIINQVSFSPYNSLLLTLGTAGLRVFDIRQPKTPVFITKARGEATAMCWNPRVRDGFVVGDANGELQFYDFKFTNQQFQFDQFDNMSVFDAFCGRVGDFGGFDGFGGAGGFGGLDTAVEAGGQTFSTFPVSKGLQNTQNAFSATSAAMLAQSQAHSTQRKQASYLYPIGGISASHHTASGQGVRILDLDIHPLANSLATAGADRDVRFWTYFGAGSYQFDKFHGGSVDPTKPDLQFNQSHRDLQQQQQGESDFFQTLRDIRTKETREGEDIFSREEVQEQMRKYICTAEDRYRLAEEQAGGFVRDRELNRMVGE